MTVVAISGSVVANAIAVIVAIVVATGNPVTVLNLIRRN
jgi:hypothetical protein